MFQSTALRYTLEVRSLGHCLLVITATACAASPLPLLSAGGSDGGVVSFPDMATVDVTPFLGTYSWDPGGSIVARCEGGTTNDPPPMGNFALVAGPGIGQVNIGSGTGACPTFVFDVSGTVATLANVGLRCASGPGFLI